MTSAIDFGKIEFERSKRAKQIRVRIFPNGLKVSLPYGSTEEHALKFIHSAQDSILAKQKKLHKNEQNNKTILDEEHEFKTLTFNVVLSRKARKDIFFSLKNGILTIEFPESADCKSEEVQAHFWNGINYFLRKEAKRLLPDRTKQLAKDFGFTYSTVKIQSSKSRWGSCSREKSINLSLYLMLLPSYLIDYVILHELCHTKEMNHGDKFWKWMDKVTDNKSKELRKELKNYNMPK